MKKTIQLLSLILLVTGMAVNSYAENKEAVKTAKAADATTSINGKIVDQLSGEALVGVKVSIEGTSDVAYTDFDGNFTFDTVTPGKYNLKTNYISYTSTSFKSIEAVAGKDHTVKMVLKSVEE
jgi:hypothetical protein